jgi:uncharacterized protein (DUF1015 family)
MTDVRPFRAVRYDLGRVGLLSDVVAPPYDVIDAELQNALYDRCPYNVVRLILNREEASDTDKENRYSRAARALRDWQASGIISQDSARCFYVCHQDFEVDGRRYTRRGFLARVRLEPFGAGNIFAHEETMPGPKADRLKLFRATAMNLSPIFGLYPDAAGAIQKELDRALRQSPPIEATDHHGVVSRMWPIADQHVTSAVTGLMGPKPIFIADGHHRYETGLAYLSERRSQGEVANEDAGANFILMMLVGMNDPGLIIMPTHRLVSGFSALNADDLARMLGNACRLEHVGKGAIGAREIWDLMQADGSQNVLGFGTADDQTWQLMRFDAANMMAKLAPEHSPEWRGLAVSILHVFVLGERLKPRTGSGLTCAYVHRLQETVEAVESKRCNLAVLVPPATMAHVQQIAGGREKMPPKSTYFYPKLLSGLVFNSLTSA